MRSAGKVVNLDRVLNPVGFHRQESTWNRRVGDVIEVVNVQKSKGGDAVTVNIGVADPEVHFTLWGTAADFFSEEQCTVRSRLGKVLDGRDRWWPAGSHDSYFEIAKLLEEHGLPFLSRLWTREAMIAHLINSQAAETPYPLPALTLAVLMALCGDRSRACAEVERLRRRVVGPWQVRVSEVAARVECE